MRYISDASYWVYIIHLPATHFAPGLFHGVAMNVFLKFIISSILVTIICFGSYQIFVRNTFIGKFLNGRKYDQAGIGIPPLKDLRKYEERFPKEIISYCRKRCDLNFVDEKGSDHYYTYKDFQNSVDLEVDDPNQEGIRIEMKDLSKSIN